MQIQKTASRALLEQLATEQRRVFATWRALILLRRATFSIPKHLRRWTNLPQSTSDIIPILRQMMSREEVAPIPKLGSVYQVTVPYSKTGPLDEYEILMEVHPYCTLSHASALSFHGLSDDLEKIITVSTPAKILTGQLPSGTVVEDWEELNLPGGSKPPSIFDRPVKWSQIDAQKFFGVSEYHRFGYPLRVTDRERTLLDGLSKPDLCGGLENVLKAWGTSYDTLNIDTIIEYVDRLDTAVLRQRTGLIMSVLEISHPVLEKWQAQAQRGGSSKLVASAPYSTPEKPTRFSKAWNLAINGPIEILEEFKI